VDEVEFDRVFRVNVKSIFHFARAVAPPMRDAGGGVIINVGSTAGIRPRPGLTWYNVSKAAVNLMSKSLAVELAPWKIRVNALWPAMSETGLLETFMGTPDTPENRAKFIAGFRSAGCRGRTMSPARRSTSPRAMLPSSPAWNCRSTAAGRSERREEAGP
jgi:NAD(P)-dependent dehydrogenase (short-subunit alcohol dehydrogenase family)